jgi:hypothetical protein
MIFSSITRARFARTRTFVHLAYLSLLIQIVPLYRNGLQRQKLARVLTLSSHNVLSIVSPFVVKIEALVHSMPQLKKNL